MMAEVQQVFHASVTLRCTRRRRYLFPMMARHRESVQLPAGRTLVDGVSLKLSLNHISQALAPFQPRRYPDLGRPSAVLIPLYENRGQVEVLLTRRAETLSSHAGQISFPGGKMDPEDPTLEHTALREASEEVGLEPAVVKPVGMLDDCPTFVTNFVISPVVGIVPPDYPFEANPSEIDELIQLPLKAFLEPGVLRESKTEYRGVHYPVLFYDIGPHTVWGATARILHQLFSLLGVASEGALGKNFQKH